MENVLCWFGLCLIFLLSTRVSLTKKSKNAIIPYTYEPCGKEYRLQHCLVLKCKRKHVIYDISVNGSADNCWGRTSGLIVNTLQCYWEPECKLQFPVQRMLMDIFSDDKTSSDCVYKFPEKIKVTDMKCAKKKEVHDICSGDALKKQGIIRSHGENMPFGPLISYSKYPWNYPRHKNETIRCTLTFNLKESKALYITVLQADLAEGDSLTIGGSSRQARQGKFKFDKGGKVAFSLVVGPRQKDGYDKSGRGFVICFKEDKMTKRRFDVCNTISRRSMKKISVSQAGPKTKQCLLVSAKKQKAACCCGQDTCAQDLEVAERFKKEIPAYKPNWKNCDAKARFPCDCQ